MKKTGVISLVSFLLSSVFTLSASATDFLIVPKDAKGSKRLAQVQKTKAFKKLFSKTESVFEPNEQKALSYLKSGHLSSTLRVSFSGTKLALSQYLKSQSVNAGVEENSVVRSQSLQDQQWALHNTGDALWLPLDGLTSLTLTATPGEDMGINRISDAAPPINPQKKIIVAVLDTGIDLKHPDLLDRVVRNEAKCNLIPKFNQCLTVQKKPRSQCLAEAFAQLPPGQADNGYLDCTGWDTTNNSPDMGDDIGHGTHVSGLIAANPTGDGTIGVAPSAYILPVRVIRTIVNNPVSPQSVSEGDIADPVPSPSADPSVIPSVVPSPISPPSPTTAPTLAPLPNPPVQPGTGLADSVAKGVLYALRSGANVIHMSLAWTIQAESPLMSQLLEMARARGVVVISSSGNDATFSRVVPCVYSSVLCVGASGPDGKLARFSNYGSSVDISGPGIRILSQYPMTKKPKAYTEGYGYEFLSGTSMSAPIVSGMVAQMLQRGFAPDEAVNRLLVSARDLPEGSRKVRTGNADLALALDAQPEPILFPSSKLPSIVTWDRKSPTIEVVLGLKNRWIHSDSVKAEAHLFELGSGRELNLSANNFDLGSFDNQEQKLIRFQSEFDAKEGDGRLVLKLKVDSQGGKSRTFEIPVEVSVPMTQDLSADGITHSKIQLAEGMAPLSPAATLRTIDHKDGTETREYFAFVARQYPDGIRTGISLLVNEKIVAQTEVADLGKLLMMQKTPESYVVISNPPGLGGDDAHPMFRFSVFDSQLNLKETYLYNNLVSKISERFQWMKNTAKDGSVHAIPAWIGFGFLPASEQAPYDPWGQSDAGNGDQGRRFYYLASDGPHTIAAPGKYQFVDVLSEALSGKFGELKILLADDSGVAIKYALARVQDGIISDITPITLPRYRRLTQVDNRMDVLSLDSATAGQALGTSFFNNSSAGTLRVTGFTSASIFDIQITPEIETEPIMRPIGVFASNQHRAAFSQTYYDLRFSELKGNQVQNTSTSLERFSFVPALIFNRSLYPAVIAGKPAVFIPSGMGSTYSMELVVPSYDANGDLQGLKRPARFRLEPTEKCDSIDTLVPSDGTSPVRAAFICSGEFLFVDLQ